MKAATPATRVSLFAKQPVPLRLLRSALAAFLGLALVFIVGLALSRALVAIDLSHTNYNDATKAIFALTMIVVLFSPLILIIWAERQGRIGWQSLAVGWLVVAPLLGWLAWDDPTIRRSLTIEEIAPSFDGASKSYAVLMRYSKQSPSAEARAFSAQKPAVQSAGEKPQEAAKWREFVTKNRAGLEADWVMLAPQRAWLAELNSFERIGDLTPTDFDADIIRFDVWRLLSQRASAIASLQALDGHGDEAIATLVPMLEVSRKLEPSARNLVRFMIARTVQRFCLETARFILDQGGVSPAARQRLAAALEGGNSREGARRIVLLEYAIFTANITALKYGEHPSGVPEPRPLWHRPLAWLSNLVFNFHATANRYGDFVYQLATLSETRDLGTFNARQHDFVHDLQYKSGIKNLGGTLVLGMTIPSYDRMVRAYWEIEDLRAALLARLKTAGS
jgi:hypothetical protein